MHELTEDEVLDRIRKLANVPAKEPAKKPGGYTLVLINDPEVNGYLVLEALESVLKMTREIAMKKVKAAHNYGMSALVAYSSKDIAETKAQQIRDHVQSNQGPAASVIPPGITDQRQREVTIEVREAGDGDK